jgi:hypothetical protein
MYDKPLYDTFKKFADPSIIKNDITSEILTIMNLPMNKNLPNTLKFMANMLTPPTYESLESGIKLLYNYSLIGSNGKITDIGEACINPNSVILKNCKINSSYLYYFLISSAGQAFLRNNSSASAQSALNQLTLKGRLI